MPIDTTVGGNVRVKDNGIAQHETHTYTTTADATSDIAIGPSGSVAAGFGQVLAQCVISTDTAMSIELRSSNTIGAERHKFYLPANGSVIFVPRFPIRLPVDTESWNMVASVAGNIAVSAVTYEED